MRNTNIILVAILLFLVVTAFSQSPHFQSYSLLKKNEPVHVNKIFQDESGLLWVGTRKGLFRFNGKTFRHYTKADSLPDENVTAIGQDSAGRVWTGFDNGTLGYIGGDNKFVLFSPEEGSASAPISDILFDSSGVLWFSTRNDGLYYYKKNRLYRLDEDNGMPDIFVYDLIEDASGNIWAGTDGGIVKCTILEQGVNIEVLDYDDGLVDNIVKKLGMSDDGMIWLATEDAGIISYDPGKKNFKAISKQWSFSSVTDFFIEGKNLWISTAKPGLILYDSEHNEFTDYQPGSGVDPGAILTLLHDREGNIWAGSRTGLVRTLANFVFIESSSSREKDFNVLAVAADKKGEIWYSTSDGLFRRTLGASTTQVRNVLAGTAFEEYRIISLYVDEEGFVWAGLYGEGVLRIDPVSKKIRYLNKELRNGNVLHITGKGNTVWLATLGGSERITISGDKIEIKNYNSANGLSSDFIYQVFIDSKNRVWFATDGKGVDMLDEDGFHHYEDGLPSKVVYGFAEDGKKQLWANVSFSGAYKFDGSRFLPVDSVNQFRDDNINCLATDQFGNLVVMHDLGIDVLDVSRNKIRFFYENTGIQNKRPTLNAVTKDVKGNLFIGTDGGVIQYRSGQLFTNAEPEINIDVFKVLGQPVEIKDGLKLKYDENSVMIGFSGLWFQHPESLTFQYRMENYDNNWMHTGDNSVTYSRLPAGEYTFRVRVSDNNDFRYADEATIKFSVLPPYWQTPVFYVSCIILLGAGIYTYIRFRERRLKYDKQVLELKVEARTREIQRKTEEIQAQNEEIMAQAEEINGINENLEMLVQERTAELEKKNKALEEYAFINAHKLRSPVASILGLVHLLSKAEQQDEIKIINKHLRDRADELDVVVRSITEAIERGERKEYKSRSEE